VPLLFCDSFDHYDTLNILNKWNFNPNGASFIVATPGVPRTGTRCLQILGNEGPIRTISPEQTNTNYTKLIQGVAMNFERVRNDQARFMAFQVNSIQVFADNVFLALSNNGNIGAWRGPGLGGPGQVLFQEVPTNFVFGQWNYIECKVTISQTVGTVEVRLMPPGGPMETIISLTGLNTVADSHDLVPQDYCNMVQLFADSGLLFNNYFDDYYAVDWSNPSLPNSDYLGAVKIYVDMPFANGSPVNFTPSAGTNWQNVDEIPPDATGTFNSSGLVGDEDQYQHNVTGVPANSSIMAVQHTMSMLVDAGAHGVTSVVEGIENSESVYLANNYSMFPYPYDQNPATGADWKGADFPASFGPKIVT
jgi:hypothetical protein